MKKISKLTVITTLITLLPIVLGIALYDRLPDVVATHWGIDNQPNGWSSKAMAAFGMPGITVDGFDFFAVYEAAGAAIERARKGGGPSLVEVKLSRYYGHFEGDQQTYRAPGEVQAIRDTRLAFARSDLPRSRYWSVPDDIDMITDIPYLDDGIRGHLDRKSVV